MPRTAIDLRGRRPHPPAVTRPCRAGGPSCQEGPPRPPFNGLRQRSGTTTPRRHARSHRSYQNETAPRRTSTYIQARGRTCCVAREPEFSRVRQNQRCQSWTGRRDPARRRPGTGRDPRPSWLTCSEQCCARSVCTLRTSRPFTPVIARTLSTSSTTLRCGRPMSAPTSATGARGLFPGPSAAARVGYGRKRPRPVSDSPQRGIPEALSFDEGRRALDCNTDTLFGPRPVGRVSRIMVTLPTKAVSDTCWCVTSWPPVRTSLVSTVLMTIRPSGSRWQPMCARLRQRSVAPVGSPWTCQVRNCERVHWLTVRSSDGSNRPATYAVCPSSRPSWRWRPHLPQVRVPTAPCRSAPAGSPVVKLATSSRWQTPASPRELRVIDMAAERLVAEVWDTTYVETGQTLKCQGDETAADP